VESITYKARDGTVIPAHLTLPPGAETRNLPLVVLPHRGPEARDYAEFDWWAQFLATRGYAVLQPQFRGSTGFGDAFRLAGRRQWGGLMQDDVTDGVHALIERGIADARRICVVGAAYGGYAALAGAAFTPDLYACAVSINGVANLSDMLQYEEELGGSESNRAGYWRDSIGPRLDPSLDAHSPVKAAARVRAPVLILYSADDTVVPPSQSQDMAHALKEEGKTVKVVELKGDDHWLSYTETRTQMLQELDTFLSAHLRN
jgi:dipeptidyl aminopeptidase/acylaminoacyl peptidase